MKRVIVLIIIAALLSVFTGCRQNRNTVEQNQNGRITVITTIFPAYDFVRQIAGDRVHLSMLLPPGAEAHSFEPSPRDIINILNSDVFIYIGGEMERWIDRILQSMNTDNMTILAMMNVVETLEEEIVEGMELDDDHDHDLDDGHDHDEDIVFDEHVWTYPGNVILIVRAITELLSSVDPVNASFYRENAASYIRELELLDKAFAEVVANARRRTIILADRFPLRYFAAAYGLTYFAAFPGCSTETEASAATVAFLIDRIREENIPVVFHIELSNERMADTISAETGAQKLLFHSAHNISRRDFDAGIGYLDLMRANVENLRRALH